MGVIVPSLKFNSVSSSLMQRYLDRILECTFDPTQSLKIIALDVLGNIIQQGLAHPVLVCEFVFIIVHFTFSITFIYIYFSSVSRQLLR